MNDSLPDVWNCPEAFEFICTKKWASLAPTDLENMRHCDVCNEHVYWSANPEEFVANSSQGRCVAVPRTGLPLDGPIGGRVSPEYYRNRVVHQAEYQLWRNGWQQVLDRDPLFILFLIRKGYPDALALYIELAAKFPERQELADRAHILLAKSDERDKFVEYLLTIDRIDEAIAITRSTQYPSIAGKIINILLSMNLVAEARKLLPMFEYYSDGYYRSICAIADRMAGLGQASAAIELYENYLGNITKNFTDVESNINNRLSDFRLLEIFGNLVVDFPAESDFVENTNRILGDDPRRKKFVLYLLNAGQIDRMVAIAETLSHDPHLLIYLVGRSSEINEFEAAQKIVAMQASGQAQFDGLNWIVNRLRSLGQNNRAIDICQWYLDRMPNIPVELEAEVLQTISNLRSQLDRR
ncbi:hypothetical protein [Chamaesiphon sp. VAR_48_metabat_403]|uniref:hypothetical protein n=1 Tax=Chamaesiphon sp. VAR_48_metabat_403 TaxID=2964700 RepID=UPI00286E1148|nr:hypothetical protein [Chamaesiphon sp. VAR_48_metabat_403]